MGASEEEVRRLIKIGEAQTVATERVADELAETRKQNSINEKVLRSVSRSARRTGWGVVILLLGSIAIGIVAVNSARTAGDAKRAAEAILDCTSPSGQCAQRAQRQTGGAILGIEGLRNQNEGEYAQWRMDHPEDPYGLEFRRKKVAEIDAQIKAIREGDKVPFQTTTTTSP